MICNKNYNFNCFGRINVRDIDRLTCDWHTDGLINTLSGRTSSGGLVFRNRHRFLPTALSFAVKQLYYPSGVQGVQPSKGWRLTASQLNQLSLTPLFAAGWGRLQLGVANWATSIALLKAAND